jgi:hypothetical protein
MRLPHKLTRALWCFGQEQAAWVQALWPLFPLDCKMELKTVPTSYSIYGESTQ